MAMLLELLRKQPILQSNENEVVKTIGLTNGIYQSVIPGISSFSTNDEKAVLYLDNRLIRVSYLSLMGIDDPSAQIYVVSANEVKLPLGIKFTANFNQNLLADFDEKLQISGLCIRAITEKELLEMCQRQELSIIYPEDSYRISSPNRK